MLNNKIAKLLVLSAIGVLGLTACDEIIAKPTDYDSKLVNYEEEVYNNVASVVYDAIREGGVGDDVLNEVLYRYAQSVIGFYNRKVTPAPAEGDITLEDCHLEEGTASFTKTNSFVKTHKAYWTLNDEGKRVNDDNVEVADDADASASELARVWAKWDTITTRIATMMYDKISSGSYSDRNIFSEKKFLKSLVGSMYDVTDPVKNPEGNFYEGLLTPDVEPEEVFEKEVLHYENFSGANHSYIEKELIPEITSQLLTEQYLLDETYNTLGRSYARNVNIIKISNNADYPMVADYVAKDLVSVINEAPEYDITTGELLNDVTLDTLKDYSAVLVGAPGLTEEQEEIITRIRVLSKDEVFQIDPEIVGENVYLGTEYGDLMKKYEKIKVNPALTDSGAESEFTGNNAYPIEVGKEIKTNELKLKKHTTTGWFIKNGGLTELPDSIRNRLFNIGVANGVKEEKEEQTKVDRYQKAEDGSWSYVVPEKENAYVARIKGKNYLKTSSRIGVDDDPMMDVLHYDNASKTYYVVQIEEACSSSKLSKVSSNSYKFSRGVDAMEDIINEVTKIVGKSESYSTLATKHYLEKMGILYHDQSVYDYFKSNYPELFD